MTMLRLLTCTHGHFWESAQATACPQCGAPPESLPLLDLQGEAAPLAAPTEPPETPDEGRLALSGYGSVEYLGKGPTGLRLHKAKQEVTGRLVLLETVLANEDGSQNAWSSLRSQSTALARLAHPGIVGLVEAGERDRQLFYNVLEWAEGPTLGEAGVGRGLPPRQAARLAETLARIVDHAHGVGVIHRGLRPGAVVLQPAKLDSSLPDRDNPPGPACWLRASAFLPRIADFGLARRPVEGEPADLELYGDEAGFLSPEQAWGHAGDLGPETDVWGLGAILHFLLTGKPPYQGATAQETLEAIQGGDPQRLRGAGADLAAVVGKALAPKPSRRYASAGEFADDLRRWALHLPLRCRPGTAAYRFGKWLRRRPALGAILLLAGLGLGGTVGGYLYGVLGAREAWRIAKWADAEMRTAEARLREADAETRGLRDRLRLGDYRRLLEAASSRIGLKQLAQAQAALERADRAERGFEWLLLNEQARGQGKTVLPNYAGNILAAALDATGRFAAVASRGDRFGQGDEGKLVVWHVPTRTEKLSGVGPSAIRAVAFSPSGDAVAVVGNDPREGGVVKAWSLAEGAPPGAVLFDVPSETTPLTGLAYSSGGDFLAVAAESREVVLLTSQGQKIGTIFRGVDPQGGETSVASSSDGKFLATATRGDNVLRILDDSPKPFVKTVLLGDRVLCLASSPGRDPLFAVGTDGRNVQFCQALGSGQPRSLAETLDDKPVRLAFSPDGKRLAAACADGTVRILAEAGRVWGEVLTIRADGTRGLAFSASGRSLLAAGAKEVVILGAEAN